MMLRYVEQIWRSPDLRRRVLATIGFLVVYRIIAHIPVPGTDPVAFNQFLDSRAGSGVLGIFSALTGGNLDNFSVAMLGLSPYINASIIIQLCTVIFPRLEALSKDGAQGQQQLNRYTRWLSLPLAFLQSYGFLILLDRSGIQLLDLSFPHALLPMLFVTTGCVFLMWLGELITEKGIGNGTSLIIFTGIVTEMPMRIGSILLGGETKMAAFAFFAVVSLVLLVAVVLFTDAHRLIPITYANQGAGRGVQGGIPIRLNQAGMIPIIFSISLITFPTIIAQFLAPVQRPWVQDMIRVLNTHFNSQTPGWIYIGLYFALIVLFTFFYVSVTFRPQELAETIQKRGGFVPGMRPGPQTAAMLARTSTRLNVWGGLFLGVIAVIPLLFTKYTTLSSSDLIISGSGMIIVVGVVMELIRQVNAQMLAHDYEKLV